MFLSEYSTNSSGQVRGFNISIQVPHHYRLFWSSINIESSHNNGIYDELAQFIEMLSETAK